MKPEAKDGGTGKGLENTGSTTHKFRAAAVPVPPGGKGSPYLLVSDGGQWSLFQLPNTGEVTLGRGEQCDLVLTDSSVSRVHAKIVLEEGEGLVVDLGSRNGTRVNDEPITAPRKLQTGDLISVCASTLSFHSTGRPDVRRPILDLTAFRQRAEEEVDRALLFQRPVTVLSLELDRPAADRATIAQVLAGQLRLSDCVGWDGAAQVLMLLPEVEEDRARHEAARLRDAFTAISPDPTVRFATCPKDGCDVVSLLVGVHSLNRISSQAPESSPQRTVVQIRDKTIVVTDPAMSRLYALLDRLAAASLPVLIYGETGTGKELAALAIHEWSPRRAKAFVTLNCAALQETLVESELFGYERGAFSGAVGAKPGLLEVASGGTVLLDEIGELSLQTQAKLLRVLETKRLTRLGGVRERDIDIRIVAATNRDLQREGQEGRFRQDLFFRLSGAVVRLPPLRERLAELPLLAQLFLDQACAQTQRSPLALSPQARRLLGLYSWPGNIRELKNLMEYFAATVPPPAAVLEGWHLAKSLQLQEADLRAQGPLSNSPAQPAAPCSSSPGSLNGSTKGPVVMPPTQSERAPQRSVRPVQEEVDELIKSRMLEALEATGGNRTRAAARIGMPLRTFVAKIKQYGLARPSDNGDGDGN